MSGFQLDQREQKQVEGDEKGAEFKTVQLHNNTMVVVLEPLLNSFLFQHWVFLLPVWEMIGWAAACKLGIYLYCTK